MDEIIIEEKKYISSKRAAKMTGYAKDYVGQLCREGRVPARLVGRSWYVLEAAINDHRFGDTEVSQKVIEKYVEKQHVFSPVSESIRYESSTEEALPDSSGKEIAETVEAEGEEFSKRLQDSWSAWFDHVKDTGKEKSTEYVSTVIHSDTLQESGNDTMEDTKSLALEDQEVDIPIRTIYTPPPKEFMPLRAEMVPTVEIVSEKRVGKSSRGIIMLLQSLGAAFAVMAVIAAGISTGYFDIYASSLKQVSSISGVIMYNK